MAITPEHPAWEVLNHMGLDPDSKLGETFAAVWMASYVNPGPNRLTPKKLVSLYKRPRPDIEEAILTKMPTVDWAAVEHAYGPATDITALLRALLSPDEFHRDCALRLLFETVWHQGTVYEASAPTALCLIQLLQHEQTPDKPGILHLLGSLAEGYLYLEAQATTTQQKEELDELLLADELDFEMELATAHNCRVAVATGVQTYLSFLESSDREIRVFSLYVLSKLSIAADLALVEFLKAYFARESDIVIQDYILQTLDAIAPDSPESSRIFEQVFEHPENPLHKIAAAFALTHHQGGKASTRILDFLVDTYFSIHAEIELYSNIAPLSDPFPFYGGNYDFVPELWSSLLNLKCNRAQLVLVELLDRIKEKELAYSSMEELLDRVFPNNPKDFHRGMSKVVLSKGNKPNGQSYRHFSIDDLLLAEPIMPLSRQNLTSLQCELLTTIANNDFFGK